MIRAAFSIVAIAVASSVFAQSPRPLSLGELYWLLDRACGYGDELGVEYLLRAGADPNGIRGYDAFHKIDHVGLEFTLPLAQAARGGHVKIVRQLLRAGANPNEQYSEHLTALTDAASQGHVEVVRVLLAAGADRNHRSDLGTALELAVENHHPAVAELLRSAP
jgi:ankyrin repeat protein